MIKGIGIDLVENKRIELLYEKYKHTFAEKILSEDELEEYHQSNSKVSYLSKHFASKEAFSKAMGTGFRKRLNFNDISIVNDKYGKPSIKVTNKLKNIINKRFKTKKINVFLSVSDEKNHSIAFVVLEKK